MIDGEASMFSELNWTRLKRLIMPSRSSNRLLTLSHKDFGSVVPAYVTARNTNPESTSEVTFTLVLVLIVCQWANTWICKLALVAL